MRISCAALLLVLTVSASVGCGDSGPSNLSGGSTTMGNPGTPAGQPRSFRTDVIPILTGSCALSSCHGDRNGSAGVGIFFPIGDPDGIYADLMKTSNTASGAVFVVARDPGQSYLYAKLNGDLSSYVSKCPSAGCGQVMPPPPSAPLGQADLDTVKTWITEGAANN